jgi:hypothetical protein
MNAENLNKLPNKLDDHRGHLSSSPFLLNDREFAVSLLESPFLVKYTVNSGASNKTEDIFNESDFYPQSLITRNNTHYNKNHIYR